MKSRVGSVLAAWLLGSAAMAAGSADADTPSADVRADKVVREANLQELQDLLHAPMLTLLAAAQRPAGIAVGADYTRGIARLGVPPLVTTDASLGVANNLEERKGDVATALPAGLALAASFDPAMGKAAGAMIGGEAKAKGFNVMLAGGVNLTRDPRGGRNFEYLGEDPLLAGKLAAAQVRGIQSQGILSTIKHFALNDQETGRAVYSVNMDEAAMRESDLLAFRYGVTEGQPGAVMCAYSRVNGTFACENAFLLNKVLRGDWGFKGYVMSDWGAVHSTGALLAGLDHESGEQVDTRRFFGKELTAALSTGTVSPDAVRIAAHRILRTIFAHDIQAPTVASTPIDYARDSGIALQEAEAGSVLLRNEGGLLPLTSQAKRIVVIGGHADIGVLAGGGSSSVRPVGGPALEIHPDHGVASSFTRRVYLPSSPVAALKAAFPDADVRYIDGHDPAAAAAAARQADVAIVFGEKWASEGDDAKDLSLDFEGDALIAAVAAANPHTIAVLETGNPVLMPWKQNVGAILEAWYPGQRGGEAIAAILSGKVAPAGRLPITFPAALEELPQPALPGANAGPATREDRAMYGIMATTPPFDIHYAEGADAGYRWYAATGRKPLYPFGFGLTYTRFAYSGLETSGGKKLRATFIVRNVGDRAGVDVPQLYVRGSYAQRLAGWSRIFLQPGESRRVTITADPYVLARYDVRGHRYVVKPGEYGASVGTSAGSQVLSANVRLDRTVLAP